MAVEKNPTAAPPTATLTQLDDVLQELANATTPARIIRLLVTTLARFPQLTAVTGFTYGAAGHSATIDETTLPTAARGLVTYPDSPQTTDWLDTKPVQKVRQQLGCRVVSS